MTDMQRQQLCVAVVVWLFVRDAHSTARRLKLGNIAAP